MANPPSPHPPGTGARADGFLFCLENVLRSLSSQVNLASGCLDFHPSPPTGYDASVQHSIAKLRLAVATFQMEAFRISGIKVDPLELARFTECCQEVYSKELDAGPMMAKSSSLASSEIPQESHMVSLRQGVGLNVIRPRSSWTYMDKNCKEGLSRLPDGNAKAPVEASKAPQAVWFGPPQVSERKDEPRLPPEPHKLMPIEENMEGSCSSQDFNAKSGWTFGGSTRSSFTMMNHQGSARGSINELQLSYERGMDGGSCGSRSEMVKVQSGASRFSFEGKAMDETDQQVGWLVDGVLNPNWIGKLMWDFTVIALVLIDAMVLPAQMAYSGDEGGGWFDTFWLVVTTTAFGVDIVMNFFCGYAAGKKDTRWEPGSIVSDKNAIALHYLRTWFPIDLVATIPWSTVADLVAGDGTGSAAQMANLTKVVKFFRFLRLVRMLRLAKLGVIWERIEAKLGSIILLQIIALARVLFMVITICHWNACIWWIIGQPRSMFTEFLSDEAQQEFYNLPHWTTTRHRFGADGEATWSWAEKDLSEAYVFCFYWTLGVMRTMPAEVQPVNLVERMYVMLFMFFAVSAFAISVTLITQAYLKIGERKRVFNEDMALARMHLRNIHANEHLQTRIKTYLGHMFEKRRIQAKEAALFAQLPNTLKHLMKFSQLAAYLKQIPVLSKLHHRRHLFAVCEVCEIQDFAMGEEIAKLGQLADAAYVLISGRLKALNLTINTLSGSGELLGSRSNVVVVDEDCITTRTTVYSKLSVVAVTCSEVLVVTKKKFMRLLDEDTELAMALSNYVAGPDSETLDPATPYKQAGDTRARTPTLEHSASLRMDEEEEDQKKNTLATTASVMSAA